MRFFSFAKSKIGNYWRGAVYLLGIYFLELANHKICQVKFGKLLEMLYLGLLVSDESKSGRAPARGYRGGGFRSAL